MTKIETLDSIGLQNGTDKASSHHNYLSFYETFFHALKDESLTILEIGVLGGASVRTWKQYFKNSQIIGADINPLATTHESDRICIEVLDQSNVEQLTQLAIKYGPFDIIIEDGSHLWEHQITSLRTLFPFVTNGGIYIVEDLQTNYGLLERDYRGNASISCMEYLKKIVDLRVGGNYTNIDQVEDAFLRTFGHRIQFLTFHRHACLIKKDFPNKSINSGYGQPLITEVSLDDSVNVRLIAHISDKGDIVGSEGFVDFRDDKNSIQGFFVSSGEENLEYRCLVEGETVWSDWQSGGSYVGTRGEAKSLSGFAVRLKKSASKQYSIRVLGRFAGSEKPMEVAGGQDCSSDIGAPLCGMQIVLKRRDRK